ncbi:MAG: hypothetical protein BV458_08575 [Thermoplasmata archaeon M9B2D]|nr:MAG: hypothetical protein BV458_08575 [Thermoplasmata archaeon M9B2D]
MSLLPLKKDIFLKGNRDIKSYYGAGKIMEKKPLIRKWLAVGIILLFIGIAYAPAMAQNTEKPLSISRGTWLYVGGSGPGNYSRIQDAINDSSNGDTIYVYSGIYYERIIIRTAIHLIGESRNTTVIDAITAEEGTLISLYSTNITITGFTLRFNGDFGSERSIILNHLYHAHAENVTISDNIFQTNMSIGIHLLYGYNCRIINNIITTSETGYGWGGIRFSSIDHSIIANNSILSNSFGCELHHSNFNTISNNDFYDTMTAISLTGSSDNNSI